MAKSGFAGESMSSSTLERSPKTAIWITIVCILWSIFQLWVAADFPFYLSQITGFKLVFNSQEVRQIHLAFGLGLALAAFQPVFKINQKTDDLVSIFLALIAIFSCLYLFFFKLDISNRAGLPNNFDLFFSVVGIICVMLAVYRVVGLPLVIVAACFLFYVMFGHLDVFQQTQCVGRGHQLTKQRGIFGCKPRVYLVLL